MLLPTLKKPPSIFNDVIGPVMRGPSISHCAAAVRIGRMAEDLMGGEIRTVLVEFHPSGSLATTHETQGSAMGLFGGFLGWEAVDPRLVNSKEALAEAGIEVEIRRPYHLWVWFNLTEDGSRVRGRFYSRNHYAGSVVVDGRSYSATAFEYINHDALYRESGLCMDLDHDGECNEDHELFYDGDAVVFSGGSVRLVLRYP